MVPVGGAAESIPADPNGGLQGVNICEDRVEVLKREDEPGVRFQVELQFAGALADYQESDIDINRYVATSSTWWTFMHQVTCV